LIDFCNYTEDLIHCYTALTDKNIFELATYETITIKQHGITDNQISTKSIDVSLISNESANGFKSSNHARQANTANSNQEHNALMH